MPDFEELGVPEYETNGISKGKWFVSVEGTILCLVNDLSYQLLPVEGTEEGNKKFYFETKLTAFNCSAAYYMYHGKTFPHLSAWVEAQDDSDEGIAIDDLIQHQVMDFV